MLESKYNMKHEFYLLREAVTAVLPISSYYIFLQENNEKKVWANIEQIYGWTNQDAKDFMKLIGYTILHFPKSKKLSAIFSWQQW